jgi:hypothetical protein
MPLRPLIFFALLAALFQGCATLPYAEVEGAMRQGQFAQAADAVKGAEKDYGSKARLLYLMDRAMTLHLAQDYKGSNDAVAEGAQLIDTLYTKSLSSEAASFLVNDMSLPYRGDNYERVMLHILGMLNYAALGDKDGALVEARQADELLQAYAKEVGEDKVGYREDALARYVSAELYESGSRQDEWDAYLDYKKADEAFDLYGQLYSTPKPLRLKSDLQRLAQGLGEDDDLQKWQARDGQLPFVPLNQTRTQSAELTVLLYQGLAPAKVSVSLSLPVALQDGTQQFFKIALPKAVVLDVPPLRAQLSAGGAAPVDFELFQDVNAIAVRDLQDKSAALTLKATARALAKFQAAREVQKQARQAGGDGAELLAFVGTNLFTLLSEQADTRSWRTLPGRIFLARVALAPGKQHPLILIQGDGGNDSGASRQVDLGELDLKAGQKVFLQKSMY